MDDKRLSEIQVGAERVRNDVQPNALAYIQAGDIQELLADRARIRAVVLDERALAVSAGRSDVVTYLDSVLRRMDE